jgi:hypothetical protein
MTTSAKRRLTGLAVVWSALAAGFFQAAIPAQATGSHPPCTKRALMRGLGRGSARVTGTVLGPWGCAARFAYAAVNVDIQGNLNTETVLFIASHGRWQTANRARYCLAHAVPRSIYAPACQTN